jgi:hypothetical protein
MARSVEKSDVDVLLASRRDASLRDARRGEGMRLFYRALHLYGMTRRSVLYKSLFEKIYWTLHSQLCGQYSQLLVNYKEKDKPALPAITTQKTRIAGK